MQIKVSAEEMAVFLSDVFPQVEGMFGIDGIAPGVVHMRLFHAERHLRPGGTVSGPSMFALADVGVYLAVLSRIGPVALAVTTSCAMDFMRKPAAGVDLIAETRLLKLGKVLAVGDVLIRSKGSDAVVARASMTYAIPPR